MAENLTYDFIRVHVANSTVNRLLTKQ